MTKTIQFLISNIFVILLVIVASIYIFSTKKVQCQIQGGVWIPKESWKFRTQPDSCVSRYDFQ